MAPDNEVYRLIRNALGQAHLDLPPAKKTLWSMKDVVELINAQAVPAKKRGAHKPRAKAA